MAYDDAQLIEYYTGPFYLGDYVNLLEVTAADNAPALYINRKYRSTDGSHWMWQSVRTPDPNMDDTTPPHPKNEYGDHVAVKVYKGG
jgi:hypothetical protein